MEDEESTWLDQQCQRLRQDDERKQDFIRKVIDAYKLMRNRLRQEQMDHERETEFNRTMQTKVRQHDAEIQKYKEEIRGLQTTNQRSTFVLALIDGDGMIFDDSLIQLGESGGKQASYRLGNHIRQYCDQSKESLAPEHRLAPDYRIVARVYANLKGLADVCYKTNIIERPQILEDFFRGFTGSNVLFDFIDVGSGKDRADEKVSEMFRINFDNSQCKQILFGCSHDNGYARLLEQVVGDGSCNKVTLLEGVPFERELAAFRSKLQHTRFGDLFRANKISSPRFKHPYPVQSHYVVNGPYHGMVSPPAVGGTLSPSPHGYSNGATTSGYINGATDGKPAQQAINGNTRGALLEISNGSHNGATDAYQSSSHATGPAAVHDAPLVRSGSNGPAIASWAAAASTPAPPSAPSPAPVKATPPQAVKRNRAGQRIDHHHNFDHYEVKQLQTLKLCNLHFLRQDCKFPNSCSYNHTYKPTARERNVLEQIARTVPCRMGTACDDPQCYNGHRCPWGNDPRSKVCALWGDACKFAAHGMHGIDETTVKTTKVV